MCALLLLFSPPLDRLEPDWMAKAAAMKLPHKGQATSAAFDSQAAHRIPYIARAKGRNESGKTQTHY